MHRLQLKYHPLGKHGTHVGLSLVALTVNQFQWVCTHTKKMGTALIFTLSTALPACHSTSFLFSVPPDRPVIYDSRRQVKTNIVEPYSEGSDIQLICEVKGGKDCSAKTTSLWLNSCATISRNSRSRFVCFVVPFPSAGRPRPNVTWYLDNTVIDESYEVRSDGTTVNHLSYPNIGRQHLDARLMCVASNTNLTPPNNKVVVLDVNRKC